jgi:hypothetical protein
MRCLLFLFLAPVAQAADIGSPVPQPTGDPNADIVRIVGYLEKSEARAADLSARLAALEARVSHGEQFAARMAGYKPLNPAVAVPAQPPVGVAAGVPPTMPDTLAPPAGVVSTSSLLTYPMVSTYTYAPAMAPHGGTRGGPLGLGILPRLMGGCGGGSGGGASYGGG